MYELTIRLGPGCQRDKAREIAERFGFAFAGYKRRDLRFRRDALPDKPIMSRLCYALFVSGIGLWGIEELKD